MRYIYATDIEHAENVVAAYRRALALLDRARAEIESEMEHVEEQNIANAPLDTLADTEAALEKRIDVLSLWLGVHDREAA